MIVRLMRVNFSPKTKTNSGKMWPSRWKTIQIMKIIRFQSSNFTSKLRGHLLKMTSNLRLILIHLKQKFLNYYYCLLSQACFGAVVAVKLAWVVGLKRRGGGGGGAVDEREKKEEMQNGRDKGSFSYLLINPSPFSNPPLTLWMPAVRASVK